MIKAAGGGHWKHTHQRICCSEQCEKSCTETSIVCDEPGLCRNDSQWLNWYLTWSRFVHVGDGGHTSSKQLCVSEPGATVVCRLHFEGLACERMVDDVICISVIHCDMWQACFMSAFMSKIMHCTRSEFLARCVLTLNNSMSVCYSFLTDTCHLTMFLCFWTKRPRCCFHIIRYQHFIRHKQSCWTPAFYAKLWSFPKINQVLLMCKKNKENMRMKLK